MMEICTASKKLAPSELDIPEKSDKANKPQPPEEVLVKTIDLGTGDSSKTTVGVLDRNLLRVVPEVDECGLAEIGNSKEETRGTQFRQVRSARRVIPYVLYAAWLWIDWVRLQDDAI
jgi:hypothetical protein